jgi:hypothetical protein
MPVKHSAALKNSANFGRQKEG